MPETQKASPKNWAAFGLLALFAFQLLSTLLCFSTPAELFRPEPIVNIDWCSQYYWSFAARNYFDLTHKLYGFDPYYMAGYPLDFIFNSSLPVQVSNIIFKGFPPGLVIKWFFLATFLLAPFNFYFAARGFGLAKNAALAAAALGLSYFWLGEDALFGDWGMLSGSFLLNFFLLTTASFYKYLRVPSRMNFALFAILLALAVLIHKTFIVLVGLPFLVLVLVFSRRISAKTRLSIIGAAVFALLVNSFWILPMLLSLHFKIEDPSTTFFQNTDPLKFIKDLVPWIYPGVALGRLAILIPAIYGLVRLRQDSDRGLFRFLLISVIAFFVFVYFGSNIDLLRNLQPYRYLTALFFLLTPAAGTGLLAFREKIRARSAGLVKALPVLFFGALLGLQFVPSYRLFYLIAPLSSKWPGKVQSLRSWLEANTDLSGRIMAEDINQWQGRITPYGTSRFVGILPALMPRYLIGGPLPNAFIRHHYASFHDGYFLNRPMREYNDSELAAKLELYNIRWAFAWSEASKTRLEKFPAAKSAVRFEDLEVFEIARPSNWFLAGSGELKADYDKIELDNLKPENGGVVLKMHWLDGFRAEPACELFRYDFGGDPIGFIGLKNPAAKVTLKYER